MDLNSDALPTGQWIRGQGPRDKDRAPQGSLSSGTLTSADEVGKLIEVDLVGSARRGACGLSDQGRTVDALARRADEGRGRLR